MSDARHPQQRRDPEYVLRIEKPIYGGAGLARNDGKAVFTPYTLPGELVSVVVTHAKASFAEATLDRVIEASSDRTKPLCPYFGACGGCHYQHASYPAQLAMKVSILEETLTRARLSGLPEIVTHAGEPFGYRNRIRLQLDPATSAPGYRQRGRHQLVDVHECPIAAPTLEQALGALGTIGVQQQCGDYFSQVELSVNHDGAELLLTAELRERANPHEAPGRLSRLCEALHTQGTIVHGAAAHASAMDKAATKATRRSGRRQHRDAKELLSGPGLPMAVWGAAHMNYAVGLHAYRVSLGSFFQVNRYLLEALAALATGEVSGSLAWDLYAGVGLFSRVLASRFGQVVAVEGASGSYEDLRVNLGAPHRAVRSNTIDFLRRESAGLRPGKTAESRPEFVLVDPPRAGLGEEASRLLAQIGPTAITYVSCDPATLSRDLRALVDSGYKLQQLHLIDLFPQTFHLETVAMLSRR